MRDPKLDWQKEIDAQLEMMREAREKREKYCDQCEWLEDEAIL